MSIVKDSSKIKEVLLERLKAIYPSDKGQGYVASKVIQDAKERGFVITPGCLSRYFSGKTHKSILSEEQIIYLCTRYGIPIQLIVGKIYANSDGLISVEVPKYDELKALKMLKLLFNK